MNRDLIEADAVGNKFVAVQMQRATRQQHTCRHLHIGICQIACTGPAKIGDRLLVPTALMADEAEKVQRHGMGSRAQYTFVLQVYTCFGAKLAEGTGVADSLAAAVQKAVETYATDHPGNV